MRQKGKGLAYACQAFPWAADPRWAWGRRPCYQPPDRPDLIQIKEWARDQGNLAPGRIMGEHMSVRHAEGVNDLVERCIQAREAGADFPTVWNRIVRAHPLVLGLPVQVMVGSEPQLKVQLINGQFLCFGKGRYYLA